MRLTRLDYDILAFVSEYEEVHNSIVLEHFSEDKLATSYRLEILSKPELEVRAGCIQVIVPNTSLLEYRYENIKSESSRLMEYKKTDYLHITELGRKTLQDYYVEKYDAKSELDKLYSENERRHKEALAAANRSNYISLGAFIVSAVALLTAIFHN